MISAIVYASNTGHTKRYAELLSDATGLPCYDIKNGVPSPARREVVFLGWLMASGITGLKKALKLCEVRAVCAVGMSPDKEGFANELQQGNALGDIPLFYLQGGFDSSKLSLPFRAVMTAMNKNIAAKLREAAKERPMNEQEAATFKMTQGAYSAVDAEKLAPVIEWYGKNR